MKVNKTKEIAEFKNYPEWFRELQKNAEDIGARVHFIPKLVIDYTKPYNESAIEGGPDTPSNYNVLKIDDKYFISENEVKKEIIVLFNWINLGESYSKAIRWGLSHNLRKTTPHVPFAIGKYFPRINQELKSNLIYILETTGCSYGGHPFASYVLWNNSKRYSDFGGQSNFSDNNGWFAFRK